MNTTTIPAPATQQTAPPEHASVDPRRFSDRRLFVLAASLGGLGGLAVGAALGAAIFTTASDTGTLMFGALLSVFVGVAVYISAGVATIRRCRPSGRRAAHVAAHVGLLIVLGYLAPLVAWLR